MWAVGWMEGQEGEGKGGATVGWSEKEGVGFVFCRAS